MKSPIRNSSKAFTLIEILVTASLTILLTGLGLANWTNYNDRKGLETRALALVNNLNKFQAMAVSGEKPTDDNCVFLESYQIDVGEDCSLSGTAVCKDGAGDVHNIFLTAISLENSLTVCDSHRILFDALSGLPDSELTIVLSYHERLANINISDTGDIIWQEMN